MIYNFLVTFLLVWSLGGAFCFVRKINKMSIEEVVSTSIKERIFMLISGGPLIMTVAAVVNALFFTYVKLRK